MQLIDHFTFDGKDLTNIAPSKSHEATTGSVEGTSFTVCGDGKFCLRRTTQGGNTFILNGRQSMKESAVMSWFSFNGAEGSIWSSVSEDGGVRVDRSFRVDNQGYLHAKYYNEELKSSNKLNTNEFAHVAMVLNSESGFSIYINGNRVAHESSPNNADINLPTQPLNPEICDAKGAYDDFRIYTGVVTDKHMKSIYNCQRHSSCARLAHAKPQSRRTYCIIPKYQEGVHANFITPCATGLYFTGASIDLNLIVDQKGVLFSFRDTAIDENGFEILRRTAGADWNPTGEYETVVLIDSALD